MVRTSAGQVSLVWLYLKGDVRSPLMALCRIFTELVAGWGSVKYIVFGVLLLVTGLLKLTSVLGILIIVPMKESKDMSDSPIISLAIFLNSGSLRILSAIMDASIIFMYSRMVTLMVTLLGKVFSKSSMIAD